MRDEHAAARKLSAIHRDARPAGQQRHIAQAAPIA